MQRRSFLKFSGLTAVAITVAGSTSFAKVLELNAYEVKMLADNVGIFTEKGGTILFVETLKGTVIVDTQFPDSIVHLLEEQKKKGHKIDMVINTHHHGDHTGGNIAFKDLTNKIVAHANAAKNLRSVAEENKTIEKQYFPTITFTKSKILRAGKDKFILHYFGPGHTNGDIFIQHKKTGIVHVGDLVFNRRHPFVDRKGGANIKNWITVLDAALKKFPDSTRFVCGHAGTGFPVVISKTDIEFFKGYLQVVLNFTQEQITAGKTFAEFITTTALPGYEAIAKDGINRPLTAAWEELQNMAPGTAK